MTGGSLSFFVSTTLKKAYSKLENIDNIKTDTFIKTQKSIKTYAQK